LHWPSTLPSPANRACAGHRISCWNPCLGSARRSLWRSTALVATTTAMYEATAAKSTLRPTPIHIRGRRRHVRGHRRQIYRGISAGVKVRGTADGDAGLWDGILGEGPHLLEHPLGGADTDTDKDLDPFFSRPRVALRRCSSSQRHLMWMA
jgi:hypothetical protein